MLLWITFSSTGCSGGSIRIGFSGDTTVSIRRVTLALTSSSVESSPSPASASGAVVVRLLVVRGVGRGRRGLAVLDLAQALLDLVVDAAHGRCRLCRGDRRRSRAETVHHVLDEIGVTDRADRRGALASLVLEEPLEGRRPREPDPAVPVGLLQRPSALLGDRLERLRELVLRRQVGARAALVLRVAARAELLERLLRPLRDRLRGERPRLQVLLERVGDDLLVAKDRIDGRTQRLSSWHAGRRRVGRRGRPARSAHPAGSGRAVRAVPVVIRHGGSSRLERLQVRGEASLGRNGREPCKCRRRGLAKRPSNGEASTVLRFGRLLQPPAPTLARGLPAGGHTRACTAEREAPSDLRCARRGRRRRSR